MKYVMTLIVMGLIAGCQTMPSSTSGSVEVAGDDVRVKLIFTDRERDYIRNYYGAGKKQKKMSPGLAKKKTLPPGLRKHIAKNGKLPPGLEGRHLPVELERRLHGLPDNYVRLKVGTDIVLMNKNTRVVLDVVLNAAF